MTLRQIHDFELALLDPFLAMSERGIRVDNERRLRMFADIAVERVAKAAEVSRFVVEEVLPQHTERLNADKAHLFYERKVCVCCRNGKAKRAACWGCAGFEKKPTKKQLVAYFTEFEVELHEGKACDPTEPCRKCDGAGSATVVGFNPASPDQLKVVLFELLRLPARTKGGKLTTDARALKSLLAEAKPDARAFLLTLLRVTKLDSIAEVLARIEPGEDGKIRSVYNPAGTETGRPASSETFLFRSTNMNNMPKREVTEPLFDVKSCVVPDEGHVFIEADFSGAEQWVTSCCAGDTEFLDILRSGTKVHRWTAARILGKPEADVTEQEYSLYKTARHALNYGMQWKTFMENVNFVADRTGVAITASQAKEVYAGYHALHPKLSAVFWKQAMTQLATGAMTTCFGRRRIFYGRNRGDWLGETHREAIAHEPQSTIADLLNRGLLRWWRQHDGKVGELLAQVYDSVLIQTPRAKARLCADLVRRCLTEEIEVHGIKITIPVDVKVCETWAVLSEAA